MVGLMAGGVRPSSETSIPILLAAFIASEKQRWLPVLFGRDDRRPTVSSSDHAVVAVFPALFIV